MGAYVRIRLQDLLSEVKFNCFSKCNGKRLKGGNKESYDPDHMFMIPLKLLSCVGKIYKLRIRDGQLKYATRFEIDQYRKGKSVRTGL